MRGLPAVVSPPLNGYDDITALDTALDSEDIFQNGSAD
jgi:hypothetical protein